MESLLTRPFVTACAMHFCGAMAMSFFILFPLHVRQLGGSEFTIGLYAGLAGAAGVLARLPVSRWLDTHGRRPVLLAAGTLHVVAWLSFLSIDSLGVMSAARIMIFGAAAGSLFSSFMTYASDIIPISRRSEGFGLFGVWGMLPNGLAPKFGEWILASHGFEAYFLVAAGFALLSLLFSFQLTEVHVPRPRMAKSGDAVTAAFDRRPLSLVLSLAFIFATGIESIFVFLAPFAYEGGRGSIGNFFLCYSLSAVAVRVVAGRLPDRVGLRTVLLPALYVYGLGIVLIPWFIAGPSLILISMICGAAHGFIFPILSALVVAQTPETHRGRAVTWLTAMFDVGNSFANPILGAVARHGGFIVMYSISGAVMLGAAAAATRARQRLQGRSGG